MTNSDWVRGYLDRIAEGHRGTGIDSLRELQRAHLRSVPFENLSIHIGEPIGLSLETLVDKVVARRRGGFCYELKPCGGRGGVEPFLCGGSSEDGETDLQRPQAMRRW